MQKFAEFRVLLSGSAPHDDHDVFHIGVQQAFAQNALADHAGGAEQKNPHVFY